MSHKKVISLANEFFIKLAYLSEVTNLGDIPKEDKTKPEGYEKSENDLPELPPHLLQMVQHRLPQEEMLSSPGDIALPEERKIAKELFQYATQINHALSMDYYGLQQSGYWHNHPKELKAFKSILDKYKELLPMTEYSPYTFKTNLNDFLYSTPEIKLNNPANTAQPISKTQMDNLKTIYYDSYSDILMKHQSIGLSGGKELKPIHPTGIRSLMMFNFWMEENM